MKPLQIQLQPRTHGSPTSPVVAGWLASPNPELWLTEATTLRAKGLSSDPKILPITLNDETLGAILFLPSGSSVKFGPRVTPLVELLPNVLSLKNAELSIGLLEQEIRYSLFPNELYLFLPSSELISLEKKDSLKPSHFLIVDRSPTSWNKAQHGISPLPKLSSIRLQLPEEEEFDLDSLNDDGVGSKQGEKLDKSNPLANLGKAVGFGLIAGPIMGLGKLVNMLPDGPRSTSPSAFDKLEKWTKDNWDKIADARKRELDKLMDLMDKDPDQGLKHALPLGGHEARRGKAPPGWTLGTNSMHLGSTQGGGAVDGWDLDYETQLRLERQYRKAAQDAEAAGNYERAAYIYGHLLNDWSSAATTLTRAGRHREAVSIYLHKLRDKRRAAQALATAGLTQQAAEMYLELKDYETAGDLYQEIEQGERAKELWLRAASEEKNPLEQARIFSKKLKDIPTAIGIVDISWRENRQAQDCLNKQFELLRLIEDDEAIHQLIEDFTKAPSSTFEPLQKIRLCIEHKKSLSREDFDHPLDEAAFSITSAQLTSHPSSKLSENILKEFRKIRDKDQLLARDTSRFTQQNKVIKIAPTETRRGHISPLLCIGIPQEGRWQSLSPVGENISVAGLIQGSMVVAQIQDRSCMGSELKTPDYNGGSKSIHHLGLTSNHHRARVFHFLESQKLHFRSLNTARKPEHDHIGSLQRVIAIGPVDMDSFMALCYTETGALVTHHYSTTGLRQKTTTLDLAPPDIAEARWFCASHRGHSCYSANLFVAWRHPDETIVSCQLNEPINKLSMASTTHEVRALISSHHDVAIITPHKQSGKQPEFVNLFSGDGTHSAKATFAKNTDIIIVSGHKGQIFTSDDYLTPCATFSFPSDQGYAIDIAPRGPRGFVILTHKGRLILFD